MKIIIATHNPDKQSEIEKIFRQNLDLDFEFVDGIDPGEVVEDGETIEENARLKAHAWLGANPDCICIADDTGLFVDALDGRPGIFASRYAGENASYLDNCTKLIGELENLEVEKRTARFSTCAIAAGQGINDVIAIGNCEGFITQQSFGDIGFGYDPVFAPSDYGNEKTFAELGVEYKNTFSHRAKAFRTLAMGIKNAIS